MFLFFKVNILFIMENFINLIKYDIYDTEFPVGMMK
jgi:hypothetical protein